MASPSSSGSMPRVGLRPRAWRRRGRAVVPLPLRMRLPMKTAMQGSVRSFSYRNILRYRRMKRLGGFPEPTLPSSSETFIVALEVRRPGSSPSRGITVAGQHRDQTGFAASGATRQKKAGPATSRARPGGPGGVSRSAKVIRPLAECDAQRSAPGRRGPPRHRRCRPVVGLDLGGEVGNPCTPTPSSETIRSPTSIPAASPRCPE